MIEITTLVLFCITICYLHEILEAIEKDRKDRKS